MAFSSPCSDPHVDHPVEKKEVLVSRVVEIQKNEEQTCRPCSETKPIKVYHICNLQTLKSRIAANFETPWRDRRVVTRPNGVYQFSIFSGNFSPHSKRILCIYFGFVIIIWSKTSLCKFNWQTANHLLELEWKNRLKFGENQHKID